MRGGIQLYTAMVRGKAGALDDLMTHTQALYLGLPWHRNVASVDLRVLGMHVSLGSKASFPDAGAWSVPTAHAVAVIVSFAAITFLHTVLGELAPKSLAIQCTEPVALWTATPLRVFCLYTTRDTLWRVSFASA
jgi:CBS domain containing-hemolysin-like protein